MFLLFLQAYMLRRVCRLWATPTLIMHTIPLILQAHGMQKGPWYAKPGPWGMPYLRPPKIATLSKESFFFFLTHSTPYTTVLIQLFTSPTLYDPLPRLRGHRTISRFNPTLHYPIPRLRAPPNVLQSHTTFEGPTQHFVVPHHVSGLLDLLSRLAS